MADGSRAAKSRSARPAGAAASAPASRPGLAFLEIHKHPPGSVEDMKLGFTRRVIFLARRWRNAINDGLREIGQSHARWTALLWISILEGKASHSELAERVGVELPTLIRLLNRLEAEGLLERGILAAGHSRAKSVRLTPAGEAVLQEMSVITERVRQAFLDGVDPDKLMGCMSVLDELLERSGGMDSPEA
jgi:MarR family transcriptional regulator for hemolysin